MEIGRENSIISVYGVGKIKTKPNIIRIQVSLSRSATTIHESQVEVNKAAIQLLKIFEEEKIKKDNIQTESLRFYPEYYWITDKNKVEHRKIRQKVEQEISCKIYNIEKNIECVKRILDKIALIKITERFNVIFGIKDYEKKVVEARELAYKDALEKANRYASLAGLEIIKAVKISEFEPQSNRYNEMCFEEESSQIPIGSIDIGSKIYCDFLAKGKE